MNFIHNYKYVRENYPPAYWFIFYKDEFLAGETQGSLRIPFLTDIRALGLQMDNIEYTGSIDDKDCYAASIREARALPGYSFHKLLPAFAQLDEAWYWVAGRAFHLLNWSRKTRFCSICGGSMSAADDERARQCTGCNSRVYPRISPAVIVAITRGNKLLLAHASRFATAMYSVIAGFVEPGETLEDCVRREIKEEVGIEVDNIRYFGSQPWPFPDSLMIAFTAEYSSGTLTIDNNEIVEAGWYGADELPEIPGKVSIARKLIDWFREKYKN